VGRLSFLYLNISTSVQNDNVKQVTQLALRNEKKVQFCLTIMFLARTYLRYLLSKYHVFLQLGFKEKKNESYARSIRLSKPRKYEMDSRH